MIRRLNNHMHGADDEGMGLVFVLLITAFTMIMLGTASTALVSQIGPAGKSVDTGAALAAAEAGIEDFVATVNAQCPPTDGYICAWLATNPSSNAISDPKNQKGTAVTGADGTGTRESFYWTVTNSVSGQARVKSVGQVPTGSTNPKYRTRTLVADVTATPSFNNFEYYTKFETFPADFVNSFYNARNIQITSAGNASGSSLSGPGTLHWNGVCTYNAATNPTCDPNHDSGICEDLYFPSGTGPGRGTTADSGTTGWHNTLRRPSSTVEAAMGTDDTFAYYSEQGTFTPTSGSAVPETHNDTCDSSFEPNMVMNGPIYSQDAYLVDRGKDTGNSKNSMPVFNDYAYSMWNGVINGTQQAVNPNTGGYERVYPGTDGSISTTKTPQPVYTTQELNLPANADNSQVLATCTYYGPTRILLQQNIAYITSPGTPTSPAPSGPSYCYTSTGNFANTGGGVASGGGVVNAQVPITSTLIFIKNSLSGSASLAASGNPIFNLKTNLTVPASTSGDSLAGTWSGSYTATDPCPSPADITKRRNFDCEASAASTPANVFANIRTAADAVVAGSDSDGSVQADLKSQIGSQIDKPNVLVSSQPSSLAKGQVRYQVDVAAMTTGTATTTKPSTQSDTFYQSTPGQGYTTTPKSWAVTITRYACTASATCGTSGGNKQDKSVLISGNATRTTSAANSPLNSHSSWPWFGAQTGSTTYTDPNNDITPYYNWYGDAYVQGTLKGEMTLVAQHDIVVTNDLEYSNKNLTSTTDGLALIADHDVRIYRPMTCTDNGTAGATTGGYCPDDLTGVYNTTLSWPLPTNYPSTKYVPDNAPSMTGTASGSNTPVPGGAQGNTDLYATVFTLQGCFMIDNFYRGTNGASANIYGGLYQQHRGPTSLPYQGRPFQGSTTKMPGVVLNYTYDNMRAGQTANGGLRVPWIPSPQNRPSGSTKTWNVVSISTGS
jgi:hypothetical protein